MIRNIRHIQIKKVAYHPNLFKAVLTYEKHPTEYDESDDLEYQKQIPVDCEPCEEMERKRRNIDGWERE